MSSDKLLEKDVAKAKISSDDAQAIKNRIKTVTNVSELADKDIQLAMEVRWNAETWAPSSFELRPSSYLGSLRISAPETEDLLRSGGTLWTRYDPSNQHFEYIDLENRC